MNENLHPIESVQLQPALVIHTRSVGLRETHTHREKESQAAKEGGCNLQGSRRSPERGFHLAG